tara:strand:- start:77 stop:406 length:330 start_codon:yes stop_codon:yes gene_type:complete
MSSTAFSTVIPTTEKALNRQNKAKLVKDILQLQSEMKLLTSTNTKMSDALIEAKTARSETFISPTEYINDLKLRVRKHNYEFSECVTDISKGVETLKSQIKKVELPNFV